MPQIGAKLTLETLISGAASWAENQEEIFPRRIDAADTDSDLAEMIAHGLNDTDAYDIEQAILIRDTWRAIEYAQSMLAQKGCEGFDPAISDGELTSLIDLVIVG